MPTMLRPEGKAAKIAYALLGVPMSTRKSKIKTIEKLRAKETKLNR